MRRGGPELANPNVNGNWLEDGSSEEPQLHVEGKPQETSNRTGDSQNRTGPREIEPAAVPA